jgi:di/tricarboxylate transporter
VGCVEQVLSSKPERTVSFGIALITEMISNNASVVLVLAIVVEVVGQLGGNAFRFVLDVTFAARHLC